MDFYLDLRGKVVYFRKKESSIMKKLILMLIIVLISAVSFAETITLKSGKILEGQIIEKTNAYVVFKPSGLTMDIKFDMDKIVQIGTETVGTFTPIEKIKWTIIKEISLGNIDHADEMYEEALIDFSSDYDLFGDYISFLIDYNRFDKAYTICHMAKEKFTEEHDQVYFQIFDESISKLKSAESSEQIDKFKEELVVKMADKTMEIIAGKIEKKYK